MYLLSAAIKKNNTRKPSYRWQTCATRKSAKNCSNYSTCLQRCLWQYWSIFIRLAVVASEICEIQRNSLKIQTYGVQGHPRSSILVSVESPYVTSWLKIENCWFYTPLSCLTPS